MNCKHDFFVELFFTERTLVLFMHMTSPKVCSYLEHYLSALAQTGLIAFWQIDKEE